MSTRNRKAELTVDQKLIDGVQKHLANVASLPIGGQMMTPADIVKVLQDRVDSGKAAQAADAGRSAAIKADHDLRAGTKKFISSLRRIVVGMFSENPDTLATFGMKTRKVFTADVDGKRKAVAKALATREARHTLGPKQKAKIHGTVPADPASPPKA